MGNKVKVKVKAKPKAKKQNKKKAIIPKMGRGTGGFLTATIIAKVNKEKGSNG